VTESYADFAPEPPITQESGVLLDHQRGRVFPRKHYFIRMSVSIKPRAYGPAKVTGSNLPRFSSESVSSVQRIPRSGQQNNYPLVFDRNIPA
jgi:hypothetical protein